MASWTDEALSRSHLHVPQLAGLSLLGTALVQNDGNLTPQGWGAASALCTMVTCIFLYKLSRLVTPLFISAYSALPKDEQRNWDTRYSSNVHAALCVFFAYDMIWHSDFFWKDSRIPMVQRTSPATFVALGCSFGYFAVDLVTCVKYNMGGMEMLLHHLGSLASVSVALVLGEGHMHTLWMLVTEFTTPLINNRWWLDKMDLKSHIVYAINGLGILIAWILFRIALFPPFFQVVWRTRDQVEYMHPVSVCLLVGIPAILTALNMYWFTKIVKGAIKLFIKPKSKAE